MATKSGGRQDRDLWGGKAEKRLGLGWLSRLVENPVMQPRSALCSTTVFRVGWDPAASLIPPCIDAGRDKQVAIPHPQRQGHRRRAQGD